MRIGHSVGIPGDAASQGNFAPTQLTGLSLWLRADQGITLVAGNVSQWNDLSGNGNNASQGTASLQPLFVAIGPNGNPAVRFDGIDDQLVFGGLVGAKLHVIAALKQVVAANQPWFSQGNTTDGHTIAWLTGTVKFLVDVGGSGVGLGQTTSAASNISYHVISANGFAASNSSNVVHYDGTLIDTGTDGTGGYSPAGNTIGSNNSTNANVEIAEIVAYNRGLSAAERARVQTYMSARYATP